MNKNYSHKDLQNTLYLQNLRPIAAGARRPCVLPVYLWTLAIVSAPAYAAGPPSPERMWEIIQAQQRTIEELKAKLGATDRQVQAAKEQVRSVDEKIEATAEAVEAAEAKPRAAISWAERTQVGGYGELHYNNLDNDTTGSEKDEVDFHRFVLYFGHQFTDAIRFFSELELEHAVSGDGENGEVEIEQAFVELDLFQNHHLRAGADLVPVGIINVTHEPPTFYGVERNPVETNIIPTTWTEAGIGVNGQLVPGWSYDLVLHSGLETDTEGDNAFLIRPGRQKVSEASADDGAVTGRVRYTGYPGLEIGVTGQYQSDLTQGAGIDATLIEGHVDLHRGGFGLRALAASWFLDDGTSGVGPASGPAPGRDQQWGWYIEPSYRVAFGFIPGELGVFARYNQYDNNAGADVDTEREQVDVGFNYWPHPDVVFKFDIQEQFGDNDAHDDDGFNLGVGYQF